MTQIVVDPETEAQIETPDPSVETVTPEPELPEKYRGKSLADIVEMHRQAESEIGRARNEIGSVRKLADELIGIRREELTRQANPPVTAKPITANDLLDNPEETVTTVARRAAEERTQEISQRTERLEANLALAEFEKKHPGFQETMTKAEFADFVRGSPYRQRLAATASKGDYVAADELFGLYGEVSKARAPAPEPTQETGVERARKASLARPGGSSAAGVVPGNDGKPRFTRAQLLEMRIKRPDEFDARQDEILEAYAENRVR